MKKLTFFCLALAALTASALASNDFFRLLESADKRVPLTLGRCCYTEVTGAPACSVITEFDCQAFGGTWTADATCDQPCNMTSCIECYEFDVPENEPCPSYPDTFNGGCDAASPNFSYLECSSFSGTSRCGTAWATAGGTVPAYVDRDAYLFTLSSPTWIRLCVKAEYNVLVGLWTAGAASPCGGDVVIRTSGDSCEYVCIDRCLPAGSYIFQTQPVSGQSFECRRYNLNLECYPCLEQCVFCPDNAIHESENCPPNTPMDDANGGCLREPHVFQPIDCNTPVCGTSWALAGLGAPGFFDVDAYTFTVTEPTQVRFCVAADFPAITALISHNDSCLFTDIVAIDSTTTGCDTVCITECVPAGTYDLYVVPSPNAANVFLCAHYLVRLTCEPCDTECAGTEAVSFNSLETPQCECVMLCPGIPVPVYICGDAADPARPPLVSVNPGCRLTNLNGGTGYCSVDCQPVPSTALVFSNAAWQWDSLNHCWMNEIIAYAEGCACVCLDRFLAVELQSFAAVGGDGSVTLSWRTASERDNDHFEVVRDGRTVSGYIHASNSTAGANYRWIDETVDNGQTYRYELVAVEINGSRAVIGTAEATPEASLSEVVTEYALRQNFPNPFNPTTSISFDLVENGNVTLTVYNPMGQLVATVLSGPMNAGAHSITFDASNLPSGMYLYRIDVNGFSAAKKMLLMK